MYSDDENDDSNINLITVQFLCTGYECSTSTNKDC